MGYIIHLESSHSVCSVAISENREIVCFRETHEPNKHSQYLSEYVDALLREHSIDRKEIVAVALSQGPGSYTGLRIGASLAKGLCYGLNIPLIAVDTLAAMTSWFVKTSTVDFQENDLFCPMIDARRMEVYSAFYTADAKEVTPVNAVVVDGESYSDYLSKRRVHFFGNGADKCSETIQSDNAVFHPNFVLSARGMGVLAWDKYEQKSFEDIAYFEPLYLKEFIATVSKKSVFK